MPCMHSHPADRKVSAARLGAISVCRQPSSSLVLSCVHCWRKASYCALWYDQFSLARLDVTGGFVPCSRGYTVFTPHNSKRWPHLELYCSEAPQRCSSRACAAARQHSGTVPQRHSLAISKFSAIPKSRAKSAYFSAHTRPCCTVVPAAAAS